MLVMLILIAMNVLIVLTIMWIGMQPDEVKHLTPLDAQGGNGHVPVHPVAAPAAPKPEPTTSAEPHEITEDVLERAVQLLSSENATERRAAVERLTGAQHKEALPQIVAALNDDDILVRQSAGNGLEAMGWQPADDGEKAALAVAKQDWAAAVELGAAAVPALAARLNDSTLVDGTTPIAELVEKALAAIGTPEAQAALEASKSQKAE